MRVSMRHYVLVMLILFNYSCTTIPRFVINRDDSPIKIGGKDSAHTVSDAAPAGPKVASLIANLKCELWLAANSKKILPFYKDDLSLETKNHLTDVDHSYALKNIFAEIEYVAQATLTLDVVDVGAFNPLAVLTKPMAPQMGVYPATSQVLSVGGTVSESPHRYIQINQSIDFGRLVEPAKGSDELVNPGDVARAADPTKGGICGNPAAKGPELQGDLGLEETLASGMIAATMNDTSVFPSMADPKNMTEHGVQAPIAVSTNNTFGLISAQIDFTVVENFNGGPTWVTRYFKGPGGNNNGLVNLNRQVKDQLLITFVPVCVRLKGTINPKIPGRYEYDAAGITMADGTPSWANYLLPCSDPALPNDARAQAATIGRSLNNTLLLLPQIP